MVSIKSIIDSIENISPTCTPTHLELLKQSLVELVKEAYYAGWDRRSLANKAHAANLDTIVGKAVRIYIDNQLT